MGGCGVDGRGEQHSRNTHAQAREIKGRIKGDAVVGPNLDVWVHSGGRRHVIVESAVLVVDDHEQSGVADLGVSPNGLENGLDEGFAFLHIVIGVLVAGGKGGLAIATGRICKTRLEETIGREIVVGAGWKKIIIERTKKIGIPGEAVEGRSHGGMLGVKYGGELSRREQL